LDADGLKPGAPERPSQTPGEAASVEQPSHFVRPQALRNLLPEHRAEERTSTWLELFFDLCFVVAVAALARGLHDEPNLGGALRLTVLGTLRAGVVVLDDLYLVRNRLRQR
jgi:hypothetical protein